MAITDQAISGVPGRYAQALYELATEENSVAKTAAALDDFLAICNESSDLEALLLSPVVSGQAQQAVLEEIMAKAKISGSARHFILLMARKRRLPALISAIKAYQALVAREKGEVEAVVISAEPLEPAQLNAISAGIAQETKHKIKISAQVDPDILGGLIIRVGSRMIDTSLKTKLQNLKIAMKGTG